MSRHGGGKIPRYRIKKRGEHRQNILDADTRSTTASYKGKECKGENSRLRARKNTPNEASCGSRSPDGGGRGRGEMEDADTRGGSEGHLISWRVTSRALE